MSQSIDDAAGVTFVGQLFVGLQIVLRPFCDLHASARLYTLTPDADIAVLPFDEELQDSLHRRFGTGTWPAEQGLGLSTTDQTFAADCSIAAPLAYVEMTDADGATFQSAAGWHLGRLTVGPATLDLGGFGRQRPRSLWPANAALRTLGIDATSRGDEVTALGLTAFASIADIRARAWPCRG